MELEKVKKDLYKQPSVFPLMPWCLAWARNHINSDQQWSTTFITKCVIVWVSVHYLIRSYTRRCWQSAVVSHFSLPSFFSSLDHWHGKLMHLTWHGKLMPLKWHLEKDWLGACMASVHVRRSDARLILVIAYVPSWAWAECLKSLLPVVFVLALTS